MQCWALSDAAVGGSAGGADASHVPGRSDAYTADDSAAGLAALFPLLRGPRAGGARLETVRAGPLSSSGSAWVLQNVNLTAFAGQVVQLVFRVNSMNSGVTEPHDIAIDDLSVFEMAATPGQAPQSGLAVLDINNARNA